MFSRDVLIEDRMTYCLNNVGCHLTSNMVSDIPHRSELDPSIRIVYSLPAALSCDIVSLLVEPDSADCSWLCFLPAATDPTGGVLHGPLAAGSAQEPKDAAQAISKP